MPVVIDAETARIEGSARVEEADTLLAFLDGTAGHMLDLALTTHLHTAVLQVILAFRPPITAMPQDPALATLLTKLLSADTTLHRATPAPVPQD